MWISHNSPADPGRYERYPFDRAQPVWSAPIEAACPQCSARARVFARFPLTCDAGAQGPRPPALSLSGDPANSRAVRNVLLLARAALSSVWEEIQPLG